MTSTDPESKEARPLSERLQALLTTTKRQSGRYRQGDTLSEGAQWTVVEVEDRDLHRQLVMKVQSKPLDPERDASAIQRLLAEAQINAKLDHPGIIPIHDLGLTEDGRLYYTMQRVRGDHLAQVCSRLHARGEASDGGEWTLMRVIDALHEICETVAYAHSHGVIHADLRPENLILGSFGQIRVLSWGAAGSVQSESVHATTAFTAPELSSSSGPEASACTDVYSLGAILYQCLAGRAPEPASDAASPASSDARSASDPLPGLSGSAPIELRAICAKAMSAHPENRYADAKAMALDLRAYLDAEPIAALRLGTFGELQRWAKKHRAATALLLVLIGVAMGEYLLEQQQLTHAAEKERVTTLNRDLDVVDGLRYDANELRTPAPVHAARMNEWLASHEQVETRVPNHRARKDASSGAFLNAWSALEKDGARARIEDLQSRAASVEASTLNTPSATAAWNRAQSEIREDPLFEGFEMKAIGGLLPLGKDPRSGLQEFGHWHSGEIPIRPSQEPLSMADGSCIIFVLLPGGAFKFGAQNKFPLLDNYDPDADENEQPVLECDLPPFLLSKFELTQAQWRRLGGGERSFYFAGRTEDLFEEQSFNLTHPLEHVPWGLARDVLEQWGLALPSEDQWECAVWCGREFRLLADLYAGELNTYANLRGELDAEASANLQPGTLIDDYSYPAPVGFLHPNEWGLHDMIGNIAEWCIPVPIERFGERGTDERHELRGKYEAVYRGGSYADALYCRPTYRRIVNRRHTENSIGIRPLFPLEAE
ncbi:MAG: sulfatase activating formylglycine-generating enzyme [Planctomycetota bacterium]|jgi:formylglycine-generating enzyme required for sulfatase activity/tRNA A-37 threonylcarbamoyl transferase component Bud32